VFDYRLKVSSAGRRAAEVYVAETNRWKVVGLNSAIKVIEDGNGRWVCDCGNNVDWRELGDYATQCEWCEYPDPPIYRIMFGCNDDTLLYFVGPIGDDGVQISRGDVTAIAPTAGLAQAILDDYLSKEDLPTAFSPAGQAFRDYFAGQNEKG
jgi:hypothetical protein